MQDISIIKKELQGHLELEYPFEFPKDCHLKYITLKNNEEFFYQGGQFINMGFDKIILEHKKRTWSVPTVFRNKEGNILYKTRFFIKKDTHKHEDKQSNEELQKIIKNQQMIIDKMSHSIKKYETQILNYKNSIN